VVAVGPRNVEVGVVVAVHTALGAVHSVTVNGPVVVTGGLLVSVNDQLPVTMLPDTNVELAGTGMIVCSPLMLITGTPLCRVGTTWDPPGTEMVMLLP
jgi:hypothetical protein